MRFIVSQEFSAMEEGKPPGSHVIIPVNEVLVILKQYEKSIVRFSWSGKHWWTFKNQFEECTRPETDRDHL